MWLLESISIANARPLACWITQKSSLDCGQRLTTVNFLTVINWSPKTRSIEWLRFGDFAFYGSMSTRRQRIGFCESCASVAVKSDESGETRTKISSKFPKSTCDFIRPSAFPDAFVSGFVKRFRFLAREVLCFGQSGPSIIGAVPVSTTRAHRHGLKIHRVNRGNGRFTKDVKIINCSISQRRWTMVAHGFPRFWTSLFPNSNKAVARSVCETGILSGKPSPIETFLSAFHFNKCFWVLTARASDSTLTMHVGKQETSKRFGWKVETWLTLLQRARGTTRSCLILHNSTTNVRFGLRSSNFTIFHMTPSAGIVAERGFSREIAVRLLVTFEKFRFWMNFSKNLGGLC